MLGEDGYIVIDQRSHSLPQWWYDASIAGWKAYWERVLQGATEREEDAE